MTVLATLAVGAEGATVALATSLVLVVGAGIAGRRSRGPRVGDAGLSLVVALVVGLRASGQAVPVELVVGVVLLALAGVLAHGLGASVWVGAALSSPGAVILALGVPDRAEGWVAPAVAVVVAIGSGLVPDLDRRWYGLGPTMLAVSAAGVFVTVPDTEEALVLLGASVAAPLLAWPPPGVALGPAGAPAALGALAWVVAVGGVGRGSSVVGGLSALGLLVIEPLVHQVRGRTPFHLAPARWWRMPAIVAVHAVLVLFLTRVAGLRSSTSTALLLAGGALASTFVAGIVLTARARGGRTAERR